ncbi:MAG TPA: ParB N-terminal domain-containing protein [Candidatus Treponema faecavium]|nr:ParB N-terminal domain-containing protein [Candidatus Treponema faecavium]
MKVSIDSIVVQKRIRKDLGNLEPLQDSLKRYGLLNPITINSKNELIAGERRLEAAKALGWTQIQAVVVDPPDEITQLELEIEENTQRMPFTDEELLAGYTKLEKLRNPSFFRMLWQKLVRFFRKLFARFTRRKKQP